MLKPQGGTGDSCPPLTTYRDLHEVGFRFVTPGHAEFASTCAEMLRSGELDDADKATLGRDRQAAILLNQSQKTAVVFAYCWKYTDLRGSTHKSTYTSFGTSDQMNFLLGGPVALTSRAGMLHPSARILVAQDVAWNSANDANDFAIGHSAGGSARHKSRGSPAKIDLCLDLVVLEDGICFGPNELELFELFRQDLIGSAALRTKLPL